MDIDFSRCDYSLEYMMKCLNRHLENTRNKDIPQIYQALELASFVHKSQLRSGSIPFIVHPIRVALMLTTYERNITSKVFIAALLHDVLEVKDAESMLSEIVEKFGEYVARLVLAVTIRRQKDKTPEAKREDKRKHWEKIICDDHEARVIKTFEDLDNVMFWKATLKENPAKKDISLWLEDAREMSLPLAHATNLQAYEIMQKEIRQYDSNAHVAQPIAE